MSPARLIAELMRVATHRECTHSEVVDYNNVDFAALDELVEMTPPLVGRSVPRALTEDGARIVGELLATFEEQS
jgi:hypothetical protein